MLTESVRDQLIYFQCKGLLTTSIIIKVLCIIDVFSILDYLNMVYRGFLEWNLALALLYIEGFWLRTWNNFRLNSNKSPMPPAPPNSSLLDLTFHHSFLKINYFRLPLFAQPARFTLPSPLTHTNSHPFFTIQTPRRTFSWHVNEIYRSHALDPNCWFVFGI